MRRDDQQPQVGDLYYDHVRKTIIRLNKEWSVIDGAYEFIDIFSGRRVKWHYSFIRMLKKINTEMEMVAYASQCDPRQASQA